MSDEKKLTEEELENIAGGRQIARRQMPADSAPIEVDPLPGQGDDGPGQFDQADGPPQSL